MLAVRTVCRSAVGQIDRVERRDLEGSGIEVDGGCVVLPLHCRIPLPLQPLALVRRPALLALLRDCRGGWLAVAGAVAPLRGCSAFAFQHLVSTVDGEQVLPAERFLRGGRVGGVNVEAFSDAIGRNLNAVSVFGGEGAISQGG